MKLSSFVMLSSQDVKLCGRAVFCGHGGGVVFSCCSGGAVFGGGDDRVVCY
jgi:hypothetical protein